VDSSIFVQFSHLVSTSGQTVNTEHLESARGVDDWMSS